MDGENPSVYAITVKSKHALKHLQWANIDLEKNPSTGRMILRCWSEEEIDWPQHALIALRRDLLDQQIVDLNGAKVVRVNDVYLANVGTALHAVAVDISVAGLIRRLGIERPVRKILGGKLVPKFIPWGEIQSFIPDSVSICLSSSADRLHTLHPAELADIVEALGNCQRQAVMDALGKDGAAEVLEEMEPKAQKEILSHMEVGKAADVLERMPSNDVADILDRLRPDKAELILVEMEKNISDEVRDLMEYPDSVVGSLMSTAFRCFRADDTVEHVLAEMRRQQPDPDEIYSLFVVDAQEHLTAMVPLPALVISALGQKLSDIQGSNRMHKVMDTDPIIALVELVSKYSLLSVPVVDVDQKLVGTVVVDDVVYEMLKAPRRRWRAG